MNVKRGFPFGEPLFTFYDLLFTNYHLRDLRCAALLAKRRREDGFKFLASDGFHFEQFVGNRVELGAIFFQQGLGLLVSLFDNLADFAVNLFGDGLYFFSKALDCL